jgi:phospholipase A1/A2
VSKYIYSALCAIFMVSIGFANDQTLYSLTHVTATSPYAICTKTSKCAPKPAASKKTLSQKKKHSTPAITIKAKARKVLTAITTNSTSSFQKKLHKESRVVKNPLGILFFQPTYIMPYYYTGSPDEDIYSGNTPDQQRVKNTEFKFQFSVQMPVWRHIDDKPISLYAAYTQLSYWQFYARSQYFRETDYEPALFFSSNFYKNWLIRFGGVHQSNGRGGSLERSWNRVFVTLSISRHHWLFSIEPWLLVFKAESSDLDNPHIARYLGHERMVIAYQFTNKVQFSLMLRNIERMGSYMTEVGTMSVPVSKHISIYLQVFHGYGQSLIEYDHKTTSAGIGISLSNWI